MNWVNGTFVIVGVLAIALGVANGFGALPTLGSVVHPTLSVVHVGLLNWAISTFTANFSLSYSSGGMCPNGYAELHVVGYSTLVNKVTLSSGPLSSGGTTYFLYTFPAAGTYPVFANVSGQSQSVLGMPCGSKIDSHTTWYNITVSSSGGTSSGLIQVSFTYAQTSGTLAITFKDASKTTNIVNLGYTWRFADGTTASGNPVSHTYSSPGTYSVYEQVYGSTSGMNGVPVSNSTLESVNVANAFCTTCSASVSPLFTWVSNGAVVTFTDNSTVGVGSSITGISWTFGDGGTGTGTPVSHTYTKTGVPENVTEFVTVSGGGSTVTEETTLLITVGSNGCANCPNSAVTPFAIDPFNTTLMFLGTGLIVGLVAGRWNPALSVIMGGLLGLAGYGIGVIAIGGNI